jgi:hypothetical protein
MISRVAPSGAKESVTIKPLERVEEKSGIVPWDLQKLRLNQLSRSYYVFYTVSKNFKSATY